MEMAKSFKAAINRTFNDRVFWEKVNDQQLRCFLMDKMREFASNDSREQVIGSLVIGRQPNARQVNDFGEILDENDTHGEIIDDFDNAVYRLNESVQVIFARSTRMHINST